MWFKDPGAAAAAGGAAPSAAAASLDERSFPSWVDTAVTAAVGKLSLLESLVKWPPTPKLNSGAKSRQPSRQRAAKDAEPPRCRSA